MNENKKGRKTEVILKRNNRSQILLPFFEIESQLYKSSHFRFYCITSNDEISHLRRPFRSLKSLWTFAIVIFTTAPSPLSWKISKYYIKIELLHRVFHVRHQKLLIIQCLAECRSKYWSIESNSIFTDITISDIKITRWIIIKQ